MTTAKTNTRTRAAFTLIELLVVIVIIGLLVTIVVPSIAAARTAAKVASCKALISTLETGVRLFRGEESLGRDYPPSLADATGGVGGRLYGAHTLGLALFGHDLQATRGFDLTATPPKYNFGSPYSGITKGPFVDTGKLQIIKNGDFKTIGGYGGSGSKVFSLSPDNAPLILDSFKMPILYYKADMSKGSASDPRGFLLRYDHDPSLPGHNEPIANNAEFSYKDRMWDHFNDDENSWIADQRVKNLSGTKAPYNSDSFLLISAGPDQMFGTSDDIANFGK